MFTQEKKLKGKLKLKGRLKALVSTILGAFWPFFILFGTPAYLSELASALPMRPNIVFIVVDSLRRDHLSHFGYFRPTSPTIDSLCRQAVLFRYVISQSSQTGPSIASFWTGLYPCRHGIQLYAYNQSYHPLQANSPPRLDDSLKTLSEYLHENGYFTAAFVANAWLQPEFGFAQGFGLYQPILSNDGQNLIEAFKGAILKNSAFSNPSRPFFAYLHFMDAHAPYINPSGPKKLFVQFKGEPVYGMGYKDYVSSDDLAYTIGLYDEQIRYTDTLIAHLINFLKEKGLLDNTLIILAPDHGEEFYEHLGLGHGLTLYSEVIDIFFLLYFPKVFKPQQIFSRVQAVDLLPTILDFLSIPHDRAELDGQSLFLLIPSSEKKPKTDKAQRLALSELGDKKAIIQGKWKFIYNLFLQTEELYNLETDPRELLNLVEKEPNIMRQLKDKLFSALNPGGRTALSSPTMNKELIEKIRSLGYVGRDKGEQMETEQVLIQPISAQIDFSRPSFNPLQLIYGWKDRETDGGKVFSQIGPFVKFVLGVKENRKTRKLIIEGKSKVNLAPEQSICLEVYGERSLLGRFLLKDGNEFFIALNLSKKFATRGSVEFSLTWKIVSANNLDSSLRQKNFNQESHYLLISKIFLL